MRTAVLLTTLAVMVACSSKTTTTLDAPVEDPPGGVIGADTAFTTYTSKVGGYRINLPRAWQRFSPDDAVSAADDLHVISVVVNAARKPRTVAKVRSTDLPKVRRLSPVFEEVSIEETDLPAGPAILFRYRKNSDPLVEDGRTIRIEVDRYSIYSDGKIAVLSLAGPAGSDNSRTWTRVVESFEWIEKED